MDRYPNLRTLINAEFGGINKFCREAGLPAATVKQLILGNLGELADLNARNRVEEALLRLRPELNMNGVWARQDPKDKNNLVIKIPEGAKTIRITWTVTISFEG